MINKCYTVFLIVALLLTSSCSKVNIQSYSSSTPELKLTDFFNGDLIAYGMLQDRSGRVTRRFTASIDAWWEGNTGYLDEKFYFDDGEETTRLWKLTDHGDGKITGTAGDVVGLAEGQENGFAFNWVYTLNIPYKDSTINVKLNDWLYSISHNRVINKTVLTKFGFKVGDLTLIIEKKP